MTLGDASWEAAGGRMSGAQRWRYALAVIAARLRLAASAFGSGPRALSRVALERIVYPDSACAKAALEKISDLGTPAMANHSLRTYVWGALLAQIDDRAYDAEILFVASALHDLGLSEGLHGRSPGAQCFTLDGIAGAAEVFAHTNRERAERMRRAVLLHLNVRVSGHAHGWEAHYVQAGAALDILGNRRRELPRETARAVLAQHPRLNLKDEVVASVQREAHLHPRSRMATLVRLGFPTVVRRAPFES